MLALVTCYFQPNYGSQLQAFATQMAFDFIGVENETIRIDGLLPEINKAKYKYFISKIFDIETVRDKMATVRKIVAKKRNPEYAKNLAERYSKFEDFANTKFRLSEYYKSKTEITENATKYSAFMVGSDQLWLPSNIAADYYTLNFVPKDIPKIAFATSFGIAQLPQKYAKLASKFLNRIDHISVRETTGQQIVKECIGRNVPVVCDPTVLFTAEDWAASLNATENGNRFADGQKYIFVYFLGNNPWQRDLVKSVSEKNGLKIVQIAHSDEYVKSDIGFADYTPYDVGPKEFVELIRDAEYVFTDSFHCTVFSMLHHKIFFTFPRYSNNGSASTNGRLYSLLSIAKHENRMVTQDAANHFDLELPIDYEIIDNELNTLRNFTWKWLQNALKDSGVL